MLKVNDKKIFILHHPELINEEMSIEADFIVHGHTHRFRSELINNSLVFNPGECAGFLEGKNKIGIVFGPERSGLDNDKIALCDYVLKINTNKKFLLSNFNIFVLLIKTR